MQAALQRHRDGQAALIPIIVRPCHWAEYFEIGQFQALPAKARPILSSHFPHRDEAYFEIAEGVKKSAEDFIERKKAAALRAEAEAAAKKEKEESAARQAAAAKLQRSKEQAAWKAAVEINSLEGYEDYLEKGYTTHEAEAHERLSALEAAEAKKRAEQKAKDKAELLRKEKEAEEKRQREVAEKKRQEDLAAEAQGAKESDPFHDLMIPIKGGTFQMGSNEYDDEKPPHQVTISDFLLCKYPVTQAQWKKIMGNHPSRFKGDDLPVESVSWDDVQAFLKKLNAQTGKKYRLPSEAEWEYAAKGGSQSKGFAYAGSNDLNEVGWYWENSGDKPLSGEWKSETITANNGRTHPLGQKKPNELGLYDMSGNVWEWCEDDWHDDYKGAPGDGLAWVDNPRGARRVIRGGGWLNGAPYCRVAVRNNGEPVNRRAGIGFRLALAPQFGG